MSDHGNSPQVPSFEADIKPLFRPKDRDSMLKAFDLWSYADVSSHSAAIADRLQAGTMPCDGAWPAEHVKLFTDWRTAGSQP
jgi:hypothetical protein